MSNKLQIQFGKPVSGWSELTVETGEQSVSFSASYIWDSYTSLVRELLSFSQTSASGIVRWMTEPQEYDFEFSGNGAEAQLRIIEYPDSKRVVGTGETVLLVTMNKQDLVIIFWRALRKLESYDNYETEWRYKFPHRELEQLTKLIKSKEIG